jgi:hypothetical protein
MEQSLIYILLLFLDLNLHLQDTNGDILTFRAFFSQYFLQILMIYCKDDCRKGINNNAGNIEFYTNSTVSNSTDTEWLLLIMEIWE